MCDLDACSFLDDATGHARGRSRDASGIQAMRVQVGRGSVTVINATPFRHRSLFDGDHGRLFVAATQLRRGDDVHFLSEDDHPSLLALLWQHGAPVVVLSLALVALVLWRGGVRFGPLAAPPDAARRSLAEQIRGTGQFALRTAAATRCMRPAVRALDEAAATPDSGLRAAVGQGARRRCWRASPASIGRRSPSAVHHGDGRAAPHELRSTIASLEAARRQLSIEHTRSLAWNTLKQTPLTASRRGCSTICARPSATRWSGSRRSSNRCSSRSSRRGTS